MSTTDVAPQLRTAKAARPADAAKPPVGRKTKKPSAMPVLVLTAGSALVIHILFCLALGGLGTRIEWHPFGIDAKVWLESSGGGENQFFVNPILSFLPFDLLFGFAISVLVGFIIRLPFFRDRVYHTVIDL